MEAVTLLQWTFDTLVGLGLLWLAWRALASPDLFRAIVLFVAFGLLMALAWVRLDAPDVALAEAAIGAGLTGALLLAALARLRSAEINEENAGLPRKAGRMLRSPGWLPVVVLLSVAVGLGSVVLSLPPDAVGLSAQVAANLETSGVSNPVTAVLLNFRGYDTLLEMVVLLLALLGVWSLGGAGHPVASVGPGVDSGGRLSAVGRWTCTRRRFSSGVGAGRGRSAAAVDWLAAPRRSSGAAFAARPGGRPWNLPGHGSSHAAD